jgi:hypothetical protein
MVETSDGTQEQISQGARRPGAASPHPLAPGRGDGGRLGPDTTPAGPQRSPPDGAFDAVLCGGPSIWERSDK